MDKQLQIYLIKQRVLDLLVQMLKENNPNIDQDTIVQFADFIHQSELKN